MIPENEIFKYNCETNFSGEPEGNGLVFEDGVKC